MNPSERGSKPQNPQRSTARVVPEGVEDNTESKQSPSAKDSRYIQLPALPSDFHFYPFDSLSIRRFNILDLKKLYYAHSTNDFRALVEVINNTIDRNAFDLTHGDFWYLMYWQRIHSYSKNPMRIESECRSKKHEKMIKEAKSKKERNRLKKGRKNVLYLKDSNVKFIKLENKDELNTFVTEAEYNSEYRTAFYPARMVDVVDSLEMMEKFTEDERDEAKVVSDPELASLRISRKAAEFSGEDWWNNYASNIHPKHGKTLEERRSYMEQLAEQDIGQDFISDAETFLRLSRHGVIESVYVNCEVCGESMEEPISIDSLSFFPDIQ